MGKTILIDQDGPLANHEEGFLTQWKIQFPNEPYIPLKDRTTHRHSEQYPIEKAREIYRAPGFFRNLEPIPGCKEALEELRELGHHVFICTQPLIAYEHCVLEKYDWVKMHLGAAWTERIILTRDKTIIAGNVLVDDNPNVEGIMLPRWHHVVFDMPFNKTASRYTPRLTWKNWRKILFPLLSE